MLTRNASLQNVISLNYPTSVALSDFPAATISPFAAQSSVVARDEIGDSRVKTQSTLGANYPQHISGIFGFRYDSDGRLGSFH